MTPELQAIIDEGADARNQLVQLDDTIEQEIQSLRKRAFDERRDLTQDEQARRETLLNAQSDARDALALLAFDRLKRIDQSAELKKLNDEMRRVNSGLQDDLDKLKTIEKTAAQAAKIADTVAKVAAALAKAAAAA
jgi:hypothetical protein